MQNFDIVLAESDADLKAVAQIAKETWPVAYKDMISSEQLEYMLEMNYQPESLRQQIYEDGHQFYLLKDREKAIGFASIEYNHEKQGVGKLHKLYVLPNQQKSGAGRSLVLHVIKEAQNHHQEKLILQVNRKNPALAFYQKLGFEIIRTIDLDIGNGFFMNDYIVALDLTASN